VLRHTDDAWRTTELTLTTVWGEGNQNLLAMAAADTNTDGNIKTAT
jgi:hypothetical protein